MFSIPASVRRRPPTREADVAIASRTDGHHAAPLATRTLCVVLALGAALGGCAGDQRETPPVAVENPTPGISTVTPADIEEGSTPPALTVQGSDFIAQSVAQIGSVDRTTTFVSRTELRVALTAADVAAPGTLTVRVVNPAPGGGASNGATLTIRPRTNPVPAITAITPSVLLVEGAGATLLIDGSGFSVQSRIFVNGFDRSSAAQTISPTRLQLTLSAADLATAGTLAIRVFNSAPGGGSSATVTVTVQNPAPTLTALATPQAAAGMPGMTLRVRGTGFTRGSVARFNGAPRTTSFIDATTLDVALPEGDLRAAGSFVITVENAAPGGGASGALTLTLVNGVPQITLQPTSGAHAGRPGFTYVVHGTGFVQGSVASWNGAPRPTQYISATRLALEVSAADVASPGTASVRVENPAPGGGTSTPVSVSIRAVPSATVTSSRRMALFGRDLVGDEGTGRLYLSIAGTAALDANSVVAVDPLTGTVTQRVFVGSQPGRIARSGDGRYLYVGLDGANGVRRVDLPSLTAGLQWSVGSGLIAGEIEVVPGRSQTVAVARQSPGSSPPLAGVTIYDDGVARAASTPGHTGANRIAFLSAPDTLYGFNNSHTGYGFYTVGIDAAGARHLQETSGLMGGFYTQITGAAGRIYGTDGSVVDAARRARVAVISTEAGASAVLPDPALGRIFVLPISGSSITVYDLNNFQLLGTIPLSNVAFEHPAIAKTRLVRWGRDGLAFLDTDELFIIRSPLFAP